MTFLDLLIRILSQWTFLIYIWPDGKNLLMKITFHDHICKTHPMWAVRLLPEQGKYTARLPFQANRDEEGSGRDFLSGMTMPMSN
jgi:hypothetical protein